MARIIDPKKDGRVVGWQTLHGRCDLDETYGLLIRWGCYTSPVVVPDREACDELMKVLREAREHLPEHNENRFEP